MNQNSINKSKLKFILNVVGIFSVLMIAVLFQSFSVEAEEPLVIIIDPGHGGENLGAEYEEYTEKDMTMVVARAMKEELEKYDKVVVYLTRDTDMDMSIEQRALFAKEKNADFLFCLHFNMSVNHDLFGTEVWVPAGGEYYAKGYSFAQIEMAELTGLGLYSRGIKTRLNDKGDNYYGILRYCSREQVPSVLIEHCHLDHEKDQKFYQQGEEQLKEFGRLDAAAVAKYFRLRSEVLGVDYSDYPVPEISVPSGMVAPDKTEPELCRIEVADINQETGEITINMEAEDSDSYILYYNYSYDGGNTYSMPDAWPRTEAWNQSDQTYSFTIKVPFDKPISLRAGACNGFDVWTESNEIMLDPIADPERLKMILDSIVGSEGLEAEQPQMEAEQHLEEERIPEQQRLAEEGSPQAVEIEEETAQNKGSIISEALPVVLIILLIIGCMFFVAFFMSKMIFQLIRGNKKQ